MAMNDKKITDYIPNEKILQYCKICGFHKGVMQVSST